MKTFTLQLKLCFNSFKLFIPLLLFPFLLLSQQTNYLETWVSTGGTADNLFNNIVSATNSSNDIYIASSELNTNGGYDLLISKVDRYGVEYWSDTYNLTTTGNAIPGAITLDSNEDIIITGTAFNGSNNYDLFVIKYNSSGTEQWNKIYNGAVSFYDAGKAVVCDGSNNVYVTGGSFETLSHSDMVTICYNSSGTQQWINNFDQNSLHDGGATVGLLNSTTLVITGPTETSSNHWEYAAVQYNLSTGVEITSTVTIASGSTMDEFTALAIDDNENVYLAGSVKDATTGFFDYKTYKLNSNLQIVWTATYSGGAAKDDMAKAIGVDDSGNVYVTGFSTNGDGNKDYLTIKYNSSGTSQWTRKYDGSSDDEALDLIINGNDEIFITGYTSKSGKQDYYTILYDDTGGELWSARYNGIYNKNDIAKDIELDTDGNVLISGSSEETTKTSYLTVKYSKHGIIIPPDDEPLSTSFAYIENRGQLVDSAQNQVSTVKFYNKEHFPALYFQDEQINFVVSKLDTSTSILDTMHRVDMGFVKSGRSNTSILPIDRRSDYYNYYLGHIQEGREQVPLYERLVYPDAYEGIDLMLSSNGGGAKYYFICKPGSDPDSISLHFTGQSGLSVSGGDLHLGTVLQDIVLPEATVFQIDGNGNAITLNWTPAYSINGGEVSFTTGSYTTTHDLIIQISNVTCQGFENENDNLRWSTFYEDMGGHTANGFYSDITHTGSQGNRIGVTGHTDNPAFPILGGMNEGNLGNLDAFLINFDQEGRREWALKIGGSLDENCFSVFSINNEYYIGGRTTSNNFATQNFGLDWFDNTLGGDQDAFITAISATNGNLLFSSYFGTDDVFETVKSITKSKGNDGSFYVVGSGKVPEKNLDSSPLAETSGKAFIARFSSDFKDHEWTTQFGTTGTQPLAEIEDIDTDNSGNLFITGWTGPVVEVTGTASVGWQGGLFDSFISKISPSPHDLLWSSHYGGSGEDYGKSIVVDSDNEVFVCGYSNSSIINVFNNSGTLPEKDNSFILKFSNTMGNPLGEVFFGGDEEDRLLDIDIAPNSDVYAIGETFSSSFTGFSTIAPMDYFLQNSASFNGDILLTSWNNSLSSHNWLSFMGDAPAESSTAIVISQNNHMFITGRTGHTAPEDVDFPLRPNIEGESYFDCETTDNINQWDGIIARFDLDFINEVESDEPHLKDLKIYPNPSTSVVYIYSDFIQLVDVTIFNSVGVQIKNIKVPPSSVIEINVDNLPKGMYFLKYRIGGINYSNKIIIQ